MAPAAWLSSLDAIQRMQMKKTRWLCVPALRPVCLERSRDHLGLIMASAEMGVTAKTTGKPASEGLLGLGGSGQLEFGAEIQSVWSG